MHALALLAPVALSLTAARTHWIPLDDPGKDRVPEFARDLPGTAYQAYEATGGGELLLARVVEAESVFDAFVADEELAAASVSFVPVDERLFDGAHGEAAAFHCEVDASGTVGRVTALYAPREGGGFLALWSVAEGADADFEAAFERVQTLLAEFDGDVAPPHVARHRSSLRHHRIEFSLTGGEGDAAFALAPTPEPEARVAEWYGVEMEAHPTFVGAMIRQWKDEARGLSLDFQVMQSDAAVGPKEPLIHHIALEHQTHERVSEAEGEPPIGLLFWPKARTIVVSDEELARHYANNTDAPEAGVILEVYVPRSPYARVTRMRWTEGEGEESRHHFAVYVELRSYPRSRSETITRASVAMLLGSAATAEDARLLEDALDFESDPLASAPPFAAE